MQGPKGKKAKQSQRENQEVGPPRDDLTPRGVGAAPAVWGCLSCGRAGCRGFWLDPRCHCGAPRVGGPPPPAPMQASVPLS